MWRVSYKGEWGSALLSDYFPRISLLLNPGSCMRAHIDTVHVWRQQTTDTTELYILIHHAPRGRPQRDTERDTERVAHDRTARETSSALHKKRNNGHRILLLTLLLAAAYIAQHQKQRNCLCKCIGENIMCCATHSVFTAAAGAAVAVSDLT